MIELGISYSNCRKSKDREVDKLWESTEPSAGDWECQGVGRESRL